MADSETVATTQQATSKTVDTTQQVTSKTPTKNPKRVAAGKLIAERTRQAREAQKKALAEARVIIANNQQKQAEPPAVDPPVSTVVESDKNVLTTTQWLSVISIVVSLAGIYYKREEIKGLLTPKKPQVFTPPPVPPNSLADSPKRGIKPMD